jgi:hypothetical protein
MRATSSSYKGASEHHGIKKLEGRRGGRKVISSREIQGERGGEGRGGEGTYQRRVQLQELAGYCSWGKTSAQSKRSRRHSYKWK